jgi:hypothetical protein
MGLLDSDDPAPFEAVGGLIGRLMSLQQSQGQYLPGQGFPPYEPDGANGTGGYAPSPTSSVGPVVQSTAQPASAPLPPDYGQTQNIRIGDYWMPQFGRAQPAQAAPPDFGDRLSAGFQSWAHTPLGNPFAALANGIAGFNSGQFAPDRAAPQSLQQPPVAQIARSAAAASEPNGSIPQRVLMRGRLRPGSAYPSWRF